MGTWARCGSAVTRKDPSVASARSATSERGSTIRATASASTASPASLPDLTADAPVTFNNLKKNIRKLNQLNSVSYLPKLIEI